MDSGSAIPSFDVASPLPQGIFNTVSRNAGCNTASDVLSCLRALYGSLNLILFLMILLLTFLSSPYTQFLNAVNGVPGIFSYRSLDLSYLPR